MLSQWSYEYKAFSGVYVVFVTRHLPSETLFLEQFSKASSLTVFKSTFKTQLFDTVYRSEQW